MTARTPRPTGSSSTNHASSDDNGPADSSASPSNLTGLSSLVGSIQAAGGPERTDLLAVHQQSEKAARASLTCLCSSMQQCHIDNFGPTTKTSKLLCKDIDDPALSLCVDHSVDARPHTWPSQRFPHMAHPYPCQPGQENPGQEALGQEAQ